MTFYPHVDYQMFRSKETTTFFIVIHSIDRKVLCLTFNCAADGP